MCLPQEIPRSALCLPEGTITFQYRADQLFDRSAGRATILEVVAGRHVFRLGRDDELKVHFWHGSPGAGTWHASVDIGPMAEAPGIMVFLTWSPESIGLAIGPLGGGELVQVEGDPWTSNLVAGRNGGIYEFGGPSLQVSGAYIFQGDIAVVEPPAVDSWQSTLLATEIMSEATSEQGYIFEVVQANAIVSMLVTGFETYAQKRFSEVTGEGVAADLDELSEAFPRIEPGPRPHGRGDERPLEPYIARTGISFQNYEDCKKAFRAAYGVRFAELQGVSSELISGLNAAIRLRHRVIHVSPLQAVREGIGTSDLKFSNMEYANQAVKTFSDFISAIHTATLALRPGDRPSDEGK